MRINEAVGLHLREYRTRNNLTLEDIAEQSQEFGTNWSAATIRSLEKGGSRADSIPVLVLLTFTLNALERRRGRQGHIAVKDLIQLPQGQYSIDLTETEHVSQDLVILALNNPVDPRGQFERVESQAAHFADAVNKSAGTSLPTMAEERLARRINQKPETVHEACLNRYGHSLDDEITHRAGTGANSQKRGRATRTVYAEIEQSLTTRM